MSEVRRIWRDDGMAWAIAPHDIEAGQFFDWAGRKYKVILIDSHLHYRELTQKETSNG